MKSKLVQYTYKNVMVGSTDHGVAVALAGLKPRGGLRKIILMDPTDITFMGTSAVTGIEFDNQARRHIIQASLILSAVEVEQDKKYGGFIPKKVK